MIGIVLVSHSEKLAEGALELIQQMTQGRVSVAIAAGSGNAEAPIGTDPFKVLAAIDSVFDPDGVVVLMDLGSAIMSAEAALDLLPSGQRPHVFLCEAPLVEGGIAAAMAALTGGTVERVLAEARAATDAKREQLLPFLHGESKAAIPDEPVAGDVTTRNLVVPNRLGIHARPAARLVSLASQFDARITLTCHGKTAIATNMNQVATLGARQGDVLLVAASGPQAAAALAALETLAYDHFGDPLEQQPTVIAPMPAAAGADATLAGVPASAGVAVGPVLIYHPAHVAVVERSVADTAGERRRLQEAIDQATQRLADLRSETANRVGAAEAGIFDAHLLMVRDPDLLQAALVELETRHINAEAAWHHAIQSLAARYRALEDSYQARRSEDVLDVGQRVLRVLAGITVEAAMVLLLEPSIVVAHDLKPSDVARLPADQVLGIITELGGATGHSAILARAMGIPAVTGVGAFVNKLVDGQTIGLDGTTGQVWLDPDLTRIDDLLAQRADRQAAQDAAQARARLPATLRGGRHVEIGANINLPGDVDRALSQGAEGVGLFRTEFLFMDRASPPSEKEQLAAYTYVARKLKGSPLIIRTLDAGGDKPVPYLSLEHEPNPFLGRRGLRYCLDHPGVFKPQLRAILRTGADYPVKLMLPMVSTLDELVLVDALIDEVCAELQEDGLPFDDDVERGIMIEVPSTVLVADHLARLVDFFSIGTNDLTQYIMAADRGNGGVTELVNPYQPAVVRAIHQVIEAAHRKGVWVGLCGELAADLRATPLLIGLGIDELSMSAPSIPAIKTRIRELDQRAWR